MTITTLLCCLGEPCTLLLGFNLYHNCCHIYTHLHVQNIQCVYMYGIIMRNFKEVRIYMYMYMYVCTYVYTCTCMYIWCTKKQISVSFKSTAKGDTQWSQKQERYYVLHVHVCTYMYVHVHVQPCTYMYVCTLEWLFKKQHCTIIVVSYVHYYMYIHVHVYRFIYLKTVHHNSCIYIMCTIIHTCTYIHVHVCQLVLVIHKLQLIYTCKM